MANIPPKRIIFAIDENILPKTGKKILLLTIVIVQIV